MYGDREKTQRFGVREVDGQTVSEPGQFCRNVREGRDGAMVGGGGRGEGRPEYEGGVPGRSRGGESGGGFVVGGVFSSSRLQPVVLPGCPTAWSWEWGAGGRS